MVFNITSSIITPQLPKLDLYRTFHLQVHPPSQHHLHCTRLNQEALEVIVVNQVVVVVDHRQWEANEAAY